MRRRTAGHEGRGKRPPSPLLRAREEQEREREVGAVCHLFKHSRAFLRDTRRRTSPRTPGAELSYTRAMSARLLPLREACERRRHSYAKEREERDAVVIIHTEPRRPPLMHTPTHARHGRAPRACMHATCMISFSVHTLPLPDKKDSRSHPKNEHGGGQNERGARRARARACRDHPRPHSPHVPRRALFSKLTQHPFPFKPSPGRRPGRPRPAGPCPPAAPGRRRRRWRCGTSCRPGRPARPRRPSRRRR